MDTPIRREEEEISNWCFSKRQRCRSPPQIKCSTLFSGWLQIPLYAAMILTVVKNNLFVKNRQKSKGKQTWMLWRNSEQIMHNILPQLLRTKGTFQIGTFMTCSGQCFLKTLTFTKKERQKDSNPILIDTI